MSLTHDLPALPQNDNAVSAPLIWYVKETDQYYLFNLEERPADFTLKLTEDGYCYWSTGLVANGYMYTLTDGAWVYAGTSNKTSVRLHGDTTDNSAVNVIYSAHALYSENGGLIASQSDLSEYGDSLRTVGGSITSSTMFSGVFSPVLALVPAVILAVLGFIGVRKGFAFIKSKIGGA